MGSPPDDLDTWEADAFPCWRPIETAPQGQRMLVYLPAKSSPGDFAATYGRVWVMKKMTTGDFSMPGLGGFEPTHWMPLPEEPDKYDAAAHEACYP